MTWTEDALIGVANGMIFLGIGDMLLFEDSDGEMFAAAWRGGRQGGLVIDEAPFHVSTGERSSDGYEPTSS